jgi:hypothetical protein
MLLIGSWLAVAAHGQVIYGVVSAQGGPSTLYQINPSNGAATFIGATGLDGMGSIAFNPLTGTLYGIGNTGSQFVLATVNTTTGASTPIAAISATAAPTNPYFGDMSFSSSGALFATEPNGRILYTINPVTGAAARVPSNASIAEWSGRGFALSFLPGDVLYHSNGDMIGTLSQSTGLYNGTPVTLSYPGSIAGGLSLPRRLAAMDYYAPNATIFGTVFSGSPSGSDVVSYFVTVDQVTGAINNLGQTITGMDAIAIAPVPEPATVATWAGLVAMGFVFFRRRRQFPAVRAFLGT